MYASAAIPISTSTTISNMAGIIDAYGGPTLIGRSPFPGHDASHHAGAALGADAELGFH